MQGETKKESGLTSRAHRKVLGELHLGGWVAPSCGPLSRMLCAYETVHVRDFPVGPKKIAKKFCSLAVGRSRWQVIGQVVCQQCIEMKRRALPLTDRMGTVGIFHELEWLSQLHQLVDQHLGSLKVHVIIPGSMYQ